MRRIGRPRPKCPVDHSAEPFDDKGLEFVEVVRSENGNGDRIGGVVRLEERADLRHVGAAQRLQAADVEPRVGVGRVELLLLHGGAAPIVLLALDLVLALHGLLLPLDVVGIEARGDEELREPVERLGQAVRLQLEVVGRAVTGGIGAVATAVLVHKFREAVDFRVLLGGDEQHVFDEVGETFMRVRVVVAAAGHAGRGGGAVASGGVDEERAQVVRQHDVAVLAVVVGAFDRLQGADRLAGGQDGCKQRKDTPPGSHPCTSREGFIATFVAS